MAYKQLNREEELESNRKTALRIAGSHSSGWKTCIVESCWAGKKKPWGLGIIFLPVEKAIVGFVQDHGDSTATVVEVY